MMRSGEWSMIACDRRSAARSAVSVALSCVTSREMATMVAIWPSASSMGDSMTSQVFGVPLAVGQKP